MGTLKKLFTTGMGAALMTEEGLRNAFGDIKVANQATEYIIRQAQKGKEEFRKVLTGQIKAFFDGIDLQKEMRNLLAEMTIEVEAKIKLTPSLKKLKTQSFKVDRYFAKAKRGK